MLDLFGRLEDQALRLARCPDANTDCLKTTLLVGSWLYLICTFLQGLVFAAPYGKFLNLGTAPAFLDRLCAGWAVPAGLGWFLQEVPAFLVPATGFLGLIDSKHRMLLLLPFLVHYFNRSFIFPTTIKAGRSI